MTLHTTHIIMKYLSRVMVRGAAEEEEFFRALTDLQKYAEQLVNDERNRAA